MRSSFVSRFTSARRSSCVGLIAPSYRPAPSETPATFGEPRDTHVASCPHDLQATRTGTPSRRPRVRGRVADSIAAERENPRQSALVDDSWLCLNTPNSSDARAINRPSYTIVSGAYATHRAPMISVSARGARWQREHGYPTGCAELRFCPLFAGRTKKATIRAFFDPVIRHLLPIPVQVFQVLGKRPTAERSSG